MFQKLRHSVTCNHVKSCTKYGRPDQFQRELTQDALIDHHGIEIALPSGGLLTKNTIIWTNSMCSVSLSTRWLDQEIPVCKPGYATMYIGYVTLILIFTVMSRHIWQVFCTINRDSKNITDYPRFSIDNLSFLIEKLEILIENLGFSAIFQDFQPIFQDFQIPVVS